MAALAADYTATERKHWSFRPRAQVTAPAMTDAWARQPIDAFILEKLREQGLDHAPAASRLTLIRRVTFDLTGLPPTPEAVRAFVG